MNGPPRISAARRLREEDRKIQELIRSTGGTCGVVPVVAWGDTNKVIRWESNNGNTEYRILEPEAEVCGEDAETYARLARKRRWWTDRPFAREALSLGVRTGRALDVGCGPGYVAVYLARFAPGLHIHALDLAPDMLEQVRENAEEAGVSGRVTAHRGDMGALPFPDRSFDLVVSQYALHHVAHPERALAEMRRVVKPGGVCVVRDLLRPGDWKVEAMVQCFGLLLGYDRRGRKQYRDSLRSGFLPSDVRRMAAQTELSVRTRAWSHFVLKGRRVS